MTIESFSSDRDGKNNYPFFAVLDTDMGVSYKAAVNRSRPITLEPGHTALILTIAPGNNTNISPYVTLADGQVKRLETPKVLKTADYNEKLNILRSPGKNPPPLIENIREDMLTKITCDTQIITLNDSAK